MGFDLEKLAGMATARPEKAKEASLTRKKNREWLRMSQDIALNLHYYLRKRGMTQKEMAEKMDVSPTYIGKLLKGQENLTLETICNLQKAIGRELISVLRPYEYREVLKPLRSSTFKETTCSEAYRLNVKINYSQLSIEKKGA